MKGLLINVIMLLMITTQSCATENQKEDTLNLLRGEWVNEQDNNWTLVFLDNNKLLDIYVGDSTDECKYYLNESSCNSDYMDPSLKSSFIILSCDGEESCVEIVGITKNTFSYRDTYTGRLHVFKKNTIKKL